MCTFLSGTFHIHWQDNPLAPAAATPKHVEVAEEQQLPPVMNQNRLRPQGALRKVTVKEDPRRNQGPFLLEEVFPAKVTPSNQTV